MLVKSFSHENPLVIVLTLWVFPTILRYRVPTYAKVSVTQSNALTKSLEMTLGSTNDARRSLSLPNNLKQKNRKQNHKPYNFSLVNAYIYLGIRLSTHAGYNQLKSDLMKHLLQ